VLPEVAELVGLDDTQVDAMPVCVRARAALSPGEEDDSMTSSFENAAAAPSGSRPWR
jgi:hypothetical protein